MLKNLYSKFMKEEDGAGLLEYLILAALAALIAVFLFPSLRNAISDWFESMTTNVSDQINGSGDWENEIK